MEGSVCLGEILKHHTDVQDLRFS